MVSRMREVPDSAVGFLATGEVTKKDYETVIIPAVEELVKRRGVLNYLMVIETPFKNFTAGAWWEDAMLGLKEITKWNRVAILTDSNSVNKLTDLFGKIAPGKFKGYKREELDEAIKWVAAG